MMRISLIVLLFLLGSSGLACDDSLYKGQKLTAKQLSNILSQHALWLQGNQHLEKPHYKDPRRARLCGVNLKGANLIKANLIMADLRQANLSYATLTSARLHKAWLDNANFQEADLSYADLSEAFLYDTILTNATLHNARAQGAKWLNADLTYAVLNSADLTRSDFDKANLEGLDANSANFTEAKLTDTNLTDANLAYANLTDAILQNSNLTRADFSDSVMTRALLHYADMTEALYFPKYEKAPDIVGLTVTKNFQTVTYYDPRVGAPALVELREAYKKAGMRQMERLMIYMLKSGERKTNWEIGGWAGVGSILSYVLFEVPSGYGLYPQRPLSIVIIMFFLFTVLYWVGIRMGIAHPFLEVRWPPRYATKRTPLNIMKGDTRRTSNVCVTVEENGGLRRYPHKSRLQKSKSFKSKLKREFRLLRISLHLSLLNSFQIGWRDLNIGLWITYFQTHQYFFHTRGWIRKMGGLQSVLSFYMFILWLLTQFGRPFE